MAPEDTVYSSCHHPQAHLQANNKTYTKSNATAYSTTPTTPPNRAQDNPTATNPGKAVHQTDNSSTCSGDYGRQWDTDGSSETQRRCVHSTAAFK